MTYDELEPGRELDALVWWKIFGKESYGASLDSNVYYDEGRDRYDRADLGERLYYTNEGEVKRVPSYSTSIAAAWEVVSHMRKTYSFDGHNGFMLAGQEEGDDPVPDDLWYCEFSRPSWSEASGDTAPFVICLAALKAVLESR
jgi:hypothetical protein